MDLYLGSEEFQSKKNKQYYRFHLTNICIEGRRNTSYIFIEDGVHLDK